jgi:hypothetical protein
MISDFVEFNNYAFYYFIFAFSIFNMFIFGKFVTLKDYKVDLLYNLIVFSLKDLILFISLLRVKLSKLVFFKSYRFNKILYIYMFCKASILNSFIL